MTSKVIERNAEDIDETVLSFAEVKALATGDPRIKEKMDIDNDIARLRVLKSAYDNQRYSLQDSFTFKYPERIKNTNQILECVIKDIEKRNINKTDEFSININGKLFDDREKAGEMLKALYTKVPTGKDLYVGKYQGFNLYLKKSMFFEHHELTIQGDSKYEIELGDSNQGNIIRIENIVRNFENKMENIEIKIEEYKKNLENAKKEYEKPFLYEEEYKTKLARQNKLNQELDLDKDKDDNMEIEEDSKIDEKEVNMEEELEV